MRRHTRYKYRKAKLLFGKGQKDVLRSLIANLIGERDRLGEMHRWRVYPDFVPDSMEFESAALRAIYFLRQNGAPPTRENILASLSVEFEDCTERLDSLMTWQTDDRSVLTLASSLGSWSQKQKMSLSVDIMKQIVADPTVTMEDAYSQCLALLQQCALISAAQQSTTDREAHEEWLAYHRKNVENFKQGKILGPRLPWQSTYRLIPYLSPGEPLLLYGHTGYGKTFLAQQIAEHIAYKLGGYNVLFLHFETDRKRLITRVMSRKLKVQSDVLEQGYAIEHDGYGNESRIPFSLDAPENISDVADILEEIEGLEQTAGKLIYKHCNGDSLYDVEAEILNQINRAIEDGRKLVVICDYMQVIRWSDVYGQGLGEPQGMRFMANHFKSMCEKYNEIPGFEDSMYAIMVAQDASHNEYETSVTIRGGLEPSKRFQQAVRIWRDRAEEDMPYTKNMVPQKDRLGWPIFLHRKDELSSVIKLVVLKNNNGPTGSARIGCINQYFTTYST